MPSSTQTAKRAESTSSTSRFERYYLEGILARDDLLYLDTQEKVLSLTRGATLIEQAAFYKSYPHQIVRGCQLFQLLCSTYPHRLTHRDARQWYQHEYALNIEEHRGRMIYWDDMEALRALIKPLGIALVSYTNQGYGMQAGTRPEAPRADTIRSLPLQGVIPAEQRLSFNSGAHILTLLSGKALVEQVLLYQKEAELFKVLAQTYPHACTYEALLAWQYGVQLATAERWFQQAKGDREAFHELTGSLKMNILRLKKRLIGFGITIQSIRSFGYMLAPFLTQKRATTEMR